jgi:hypothetical protein
MIRQPALPRSTAPTPRDGTRSIAQEIDREAFEQIIAASALTKDVSQRPIAERTGIAADLWCFITDVAIRLPHEEHFPWEEAIAALTRLSAPIALAAIARWSDEGVAGHSETLEYFIREGLRLKEVPPAVATALLALIRRPEDETISEIATAALRGDETTRTKILERLAVDAFVTFPSHNPQHYISALVEPTEKAGAMFPSLPSLREQLPFFVKLDKLPIRKSRTSTSQAVALRDPTPPDLSGRRFTTAADIEKAIEETAQQEKHFYRRVLFSEMKNQTEARDRADFLSALAGANIDWVWEDDRARVILSALAEWQGLPAVEQWRRQRLPVFILANFFGLTRWLRQGSDVFPRILEAASLAPADRSKLLIEGAESTELGLSSRSLFGIAALIARSLAPDESWALLKWYRDRLDKRVSSAEAQRLEPTDIPVGLDAGLGRFVYALLTDIDTRERWRSAHVLRRLSALGAHGPVNHAFQNYDRTEDKSFRDPTAPYYHLAGRLWLTTAAARIAVETPAALFDEAPRLARIALDEAFPHVLVREYAKSAALALCRLKLDLLPAETQKKLASANTPRNAKRIKHANYNRGGLSWQESEGRRFHFNSMDTLPYWYTPLLRYFPNVTGKKFLDLAELWIVDHWGGAKETHFWDREGRKARLREDRFRLWYNGHGALPVIERYGTYLEWHAMFMVVGELIKTEPLLHSSHGDRGYPEWVDEHMVSEPPGWLADRRDPVPLEIGLWYEGPVEDKFWIRSTSRDEFLGAVGLPTGSPDAFLTVYGDWTAAFPTREVNTNVMTALVSPATAAALVRACQTAASPYDYHFPAEREDDQIDNGPHRLAGWISILQRSSGLDSHDPVANDIGTLAAKPGKLVTKRLKLLEGPAPVREWRKGNDNQVTFRYVSWDDLPKTYDDTDSRRVENSHGHRLQIRATALFEFLQEQKMDLILEITVERRIENEYRGNYGSEKTKHKSFTKILLLRNSGEVEDITGYIGSWTKARRRIEA